MNEFEATTVDARELWKGSFKDRLGDLGRMADESAHAGGVTDGD